MRLAFPFRPSALGRSDVVAYGSDAHVRQMLELLVFTVPGERVMRRDLGSPVRQRVFGPLGGATAVALDSALSAAIGQWLGDVLTLIDLTVTGLDADAALEVVIVYEIRATRMVGEVRVRQDLT
ncbi:GPW/gp25 family protein [Actinomycetospora lutea]|uniref:GPW/gp25 family protein n=1 Tax=Actinomycetospora lutea TaxID=663604 RepID=UPI0023657381|nr:GPW/gp25 family protein [Actinomycetospora lutea]MDD7942414.1 GPW/gp25 family protein [Actinomycetospora lutea]